MLYSVIYQETLLNQMTTGRMPSGETHIYLYWAYSTFQSTNPNTILTVTSQALRYQFLIQWKEVRHRRAVPWDKEEWNSAQAKQQREKGKHWSMWWKKWTNNGVWAERRMSGRGTSEQAQSGQHSHLRLANKQDPGVPSTFTGLLF